ncbi:hypothetical protein WDW37_09250 [Bdellovibrionota bacterium FG-1]
MHLVRHFREYFKIVKSVREGIKIKSITVHYVGKLTFAERERLKILLKEVRTKKDLAAALKQTKDSSLKVVEAGPVHEAGSQKNKVKLVAVREGVYKKVIDQDWLKQAYLKDKMGVGQIAQILGLGEDRVRDHLEKLGITAQERIKLAHVRNERTHLAFGWHVINGQKVKDPTEWEVIEQMTKWRNIDELTFDAIADKLTKMGVAGKLGVVIWDRGSVRRVILRNSKRGPKLT